MSNVSTSHNVVLFVAGKSSALSGQRLAKIGYKSTKDKDTGKTIAPKYPSICTSVPFIDADTITPEQMGQLRPHLIKVLENAQDGIIQSLYESRDGVLSAVNDSEISIDACIAFLDSDSESGRWTKEFLGQWFDANLRDNLFIQIGAKMKFWTLGDDTDTVEYTDAQEEKVNQALNGVKGLISGLAGGKTEYAVPVAKNLINLVGLSAYEDEVSGKLVNRLQRMIDKSAEQENALGFMAD